MTFLHEQHAPELSLPAVVLIHFGSPDLTKRCLESLRELELEPHSVIIVDHGPEPGLGRSLEGVHPRLSVLEDFSNPGFGCGCNRGAAHAFDAGASAVWFLNNDAVLEGPTLAPLMRLVEAHPEVGLWGTHQQNGRRLQGADRMDGWFCRGIRQGALAVPEGCRQLTPRETLSGASLLVSRGAWERIGCWPTGFFLYWEDAAWCRKAHALGLPIILSGLRIIHRSARTVGKRSPLQAFYSARNRLLLHRELHPNRCVRLFQGRPRLLRAAWHGVWAAHHGLDGRDPRY